MKILPWVLLLWILNGYAKDFGTEGPTFEIKEQNMLEWIRERLKLMQETGELEKHQASFKKRAIHAVMRPKRVEGIMRTMEEKTFLYDPSITIEEPIMMQGKQILYPRGTTVNPLDKVSLIYALLFIDGDDHEQVAWAIDHPAKSKRIILVNGPIMDLMKAHETRLYFDQGGRVTSKFGITHVPALVTQLGNKLQIQEVVI